MEERFILLFSYFLFMLVIRLFFKPLRHNSFVSSSFSSDLHYFGKKNHVFLELYIFLFSFFLLVFFFFFFFFFLQCRFSFLCLFLNWSIFCLKFSFFIFPFLLLAIFAPRKCYFLEDSFSTERKVNIVCLTLLRNNQMQNLRDGHNVIKPNKKTNFFTSRLQKRLIRAFDMRIWFLQEACTQVFVSRTC